MRSIDLLLPAASAVLSLTAFSQSWCPPGAQWVYGLDVPGIQGYSRFHYDGDTLLHDTTGYRIGLEEVLVFSPDPTPVVSNYENVAITSYANDVVTSWDQLSETWDTLFWFGAQVGEFWQPPHYQGECGDAERIAVEAVGTEVVDGFTLRWLDLADGRGRIMERAGWYWNMEITPSCLIVEGLMGMRCYTDNTINYAPPSWGQDCFAIGMNELGDAQPLLLYPNPGSDRFALDLDHGTHVITLYDATGRSVLRTSGSGRTIVDASSLANGVHTAVVVGANGTLRSGAWMKQ